MDKMSTQTYYIAFFLFLVLLTNWFFGQKSAFYLLLVVLLGTLITRYKAIDTLQTKIIGKK